ncbi:hypothetical protein [Streptomyces olivaceoviridis]|uniref:hypothetical protein n=1 Tax=Streptomyces olivaceoviridis TaxID=1921 RepID=UPI0037010B38
MALHTADAGHVPSKGRAIVTYDGPAADPSAVTELVAAGITHILLASQSPWPAQVVRWLVNEIITPVGTVAI